MWPNASFALFTSNKMFLTKRWDRFHLRGLPHHPRFLPGWRYTECLDGSEMQAEVSWKCGPSGFVGATPDYSHCCKHACRAKDSYGVLFKACKGEVAHGSCPNHLAGTASWTCGDGSSFVGDSPDYSDCYPSWVNSVQDMVKICNYSSLPVGRNLPMYVFSSQDSPERHVLL